MRRVYVNYNICVRHCSRRNRFMNNVYGFLQKRKKKKWTSTELNFYSPLWGFSRLAHSSLCSGDRPIHTHTLYRRWIAPKNNKSPSFTPRAQWHRFQLLFAGQILQALTLSLSRSHSLSTAASFLLRLTTVQKQQKTIIRRAQRTARNRFRGLLCAVSHAHRAKHKTYYYILRPPTFGENR